MNIGELAHLTGLTVKALRHYDETGVIVPAHVDPVTRYRSYTACQVRDALVVHALRSAGVGLPTIRAALADGADVDEVLDAHRARIDAERAAQDAAEADARALAAALRSTPPVERRTASAQPYAAVLVPLEEHEDVEVTNEVAGAAFAELFGALAESGVAPAGAFWTTFRVVGARKDGRVPRAVAPSTGLALGWPVDRALPAGWEVTGRTTEVGVLPEREELAVRWSFEDQDGPRSSMHPAVVALLEAIEAHDGEVDLSEVRQVALLDAEGDQTGVELVCTILPAAA